MMTAEDFRQAIAASPHDLNLLSAYADWLDQDGRGTWETERCPGCKGQGTIFDPLRAYA